MNKYVKIKKKVAKVVANLEALDNAQLSDLEDLLDELLESIDEDDEVIDEEDDNTDDLFDDEDDDDVMSLVEAHPVVVEPKTSFDFNK